MKKVKHVILVISALLITSVTATSQTWSYADCVEYARIHNISLQKTSLNEQTADIELAQSRAAWYPTVDFGMTHGYANSPFASGQKNSFNGNYNINGSWTAWDGGVRGYNIKRGKVQTEIARLNTGDALRTIETDLLQVYINILYASEAVDICAEAVDLSYAQAQRAKALMESGRISRVDYSRLNSQYEQDRYALVSAHTTLEGRRLELKNLLELGIEEDFEIAHISWPDALALEQLPDMAETYRLAMATDLRIRSLEADSIMSDIDVKIAKAGRLPQLSLNAGVGTGFITPGGAVGISLKRNFGESLGLTFSIPIYDADKTKNAVAMARVQQLDAQLDIEKRRTELAQTVENWYIDTRSAQARYIAAISALESAQLTDELTNEQFKLGYVNTVELMDAHNAYTEARHSKLQAKYMALLGRKMIEFYRDGKVIIE